MLVTLLNNVKIEALAADERVCDSECGSLLFRQEWPFPLLTGLRIKQETHSMEGKQASVCLRSVEQVHSGFSDTW